ncbi:SUMF1/EgtB/PvdO family nonheme iron enzyme [Sulfuriflexus sp.]|uniref:SUMF1/EgtB/PvdO family nonheme iron enzyme n=1 Tax=Sulfuriflexus sp. TaxID=2015443 RepID=UPI0028D54D88|nr:SUMF1/EgtB/PvdO family nonheme iron enzyme [Sulfuriflexus sp.]
MSIISPRTLSELQAVQKLINETGRTLSDHDYRAQYHVDLSPLGWHVGHCAFLETFWLRETLLGDDSDTAGHHELYFPENLPKPQRGPALPEQQAHIDWCEQLQAENRALMQNPPTALREQAVTRNDYLARFLLQHHAQHYETMIMVLSQGQLKGSQHDFAVQHKLRAALPANDMLELDSGDYRIGYAGGVDAFDNELPAQTVFIHNTSLARHPVSNANWLAFMDDGGYTQARFWSADGWQWRCENNIEHPEQWRQNTRGDWFTVTYDGAHELAANDAVSGVNYYEANAFVSWLRATDANFRSACLPHEYALEAAQQQGGLEGSGQVWEWCANTFHPYAGFKAFPYDNYSRPWFDGKHYTLRGSSPYTQATIKRPSFRNFYNPDKRHIFSGLRLTLALAL